MGPKIRALGVLALSVLAVGLVAAGCGGGGSSSSSTESTESTTAEAPGESSGAEVEVGGGKTVTVPAGKLKIGLFPPSNSNEYLKEWIASGEAEAKAKGFETVVYESEFEPIKQLQQIETALQQGELNGLVILPNDGKLICKALSEEAPDANVLVVPTSIPICEANLTPAGEKSAEGMWVPGTLAFVGSNNYIGYQEKWFEATEEANPGPQKAAVVLGTATISQTHLTEIAQEHWEEKNPDHEMEVTDYINTDYTSADGLAKTQNYLQANSDTTVLMSIYSPDLTRGVLQAVSEAGLKGKIGVTDQGGSTYSFEQVENGSLEFTMGLFPKNMTKLAVDAIAEAAEGKKVPHYIDDSRFGSSEEPTIITKQNIGEFEPEF
jgi:ABC-type sugar transport system substrate-binding protein